MVLTKQQRERNFKERFNEWLDTIFQAGPAFSLERIEELEREGRESVERRRAMSSTPRPAEERDVLGELVFRKVSTEEEARAIRAPMTRKGLDSALALAEEIDSAERPRDLDLRRWTEVS